MKAIHVAVAGLVLVMLVSVGVQAQETRESATVIREGPGGEVQILSTERVVPETPAPTRTREPAAEMDGEVRKARVMVIPAVFAQERRRRIDRELNERFGITDPGIIEDPGYTSYLIDALVNVRKFDMVERDELKQLVRELDFGESDYVDVDKVVRIGNMVGADYMIIPVIRYLEVDQESKDVPYIGGRQIAIRGKLATNVRTVDISTGRIIASNVREVEKRKRAREQDSQRIMVMDVIGECYKENAMLEAANIVDVAYPIRIMSIDGNTVMLNRGQGAILKGEVLKVYAAGEMMVDPDTGDNLGYQEAYLGEVQVSEVGQKTSKATVTKATAPIERLAICRRTAEPTLEDPRLKRPPVAPRID